MATFSVIVPLFNKAEFVVDAVNSILSQQVTDLEVVVIDDGSTDDGLRRLGTITDSRLKIFEQLNSGVSLARNHGINLSTGEYLCFLDADDFWAHDHLTKIFDLISEDPSAIAWAVGYREFDSLCSQNMLQEFSSKSDVCSVSLSYQDFLLRWSERPFFWTGSITTRRSTLLQTQTFFQPGENQGEDQDLWFRLSELGRIRFLDVRSTAYYRRNVSSSLTSAAVLDPLPSLIRMLERSRLRPHVEQRAANHLFNVHLLHVAWANCLSGKKRRAISLLWEIGPTARFSYWLRIMLCSLLPSRLVSGILLSRQKKIFKKNN